MRTSYEGGLLFRKKKNELKAVNLGADYCAEHEWGVAGLKNRLGIDTTTAGYGLSTRTITKNEYVVWHDGKKYSGIHTAIIGGGDIESHVTGRRPSTPPDDKRPLFCGWNESSFYVMADNSDAKTIEFLKELHDAFKRNDICVWLGGGGVFKNAGLCFGIISRMPKEVFQQWAESDKAKADAQTWFEKTGIKKILADAGKRYFYLGPDKKNDDGTYSFWLNPMEQHKYNSCWCKLNDLKLWAQDKGPIVKDKRK